MCVCVKGNSKVLAILLLYKVRLLPRLFTYNNVQWSSILDVLFPHNLPRFTFVIIITILLLSSSSALSFYYYYYYCYKFAQNQLDALKAKLFACLIKLYCQTRYHHHHQLYFFHIIGIPPPPRPAPGNDNFI